MDLKEIRLSFLKNSSNCYQSFKPLLELQGATESALVHQLESYQKNNEVKMLSEA